MDLHVIVISLGAMAFALPALLLPQCPATFPAIVAVVVPQGRILFHTIDIAGRKRAASDAESAPIYFLLNQLCLCGILLAYVVIGRALQS